MIASRRFSFSIRLISSILLLCIMILGASGFYLDHLYKKTISKRIEENMRDLMFGLVALTEVQESQRIRLPALLPLARLNQAGSGLYATILDENNIQIWESSSTLHPNVILPTINYANRNFDFKIIENIKRVKYFSYHSKIDIQHPKSRKLHFLVYQSMEDYLNDVHTYRQSLIAWLAGFTLLLVFVAFLLARWNLRPIDQAVEEVKLLEQGKLDSLSTQYPIELQALVSGIDQLAQSNKEQVEKHRAALDNLAHSLKTPITLIQSTVEDFSQSLPEEFKNQIIGQTAGIGETIHYQLAKAATRGKAQYDKYTDVLQLVNKTITIFRKIYPDKNIQYIPPNLDHLNYNVDESDLLEVLGNVLDNAGKWAKANIKLQCRFINSRVHFIVEDDGIGIDADMKELLSKRGARIQSGKPGSGIGLAIVFDVVKQYGGSIEIDQSSSLGGTRICVQL